MDNQSIVEIRKGLEQQFRFKLYKDPKFPFLHSMGMKHMFQGFDAQEDGYIGTLHLWWSNESGEPSYHTNNKQFLSGYWKSEWIDDATEAIELAIECERKNNPYAEQLIKAFVKEQARQSEILAKDMLDKKFKKDMKKIEEESKTVLWN
tara:strand:- start:149 stop:595 length:447 start_codon:yes stop_codon:yes gene_type:complete